MFHGLEAKTQYHSVKPDLSIISLEDLGYHPCNIKIDPLGLSNRLGLMPDDIKDITPENYKLLLVDFMCDRVTYPGGSIFPEASFGDPDLYYFDLDINTAFDDFLNSYSSNLPICSDEQIRNECFGSSFLHNGIYMGEWRNGKPNGLGIIFITSKFPRTVGYNKEAIYKGEFKDGYPHGNGHYNNGITSYEGRWFEGERHGAVEWIFPQTRRFGLFYSRDEDFKSFKITQVEEKSNLQKNGIKVNDLVVGLQLLNNENPIETKSLAMMKFSQILRENDSIVLYINSFENPIKISKTLFDENYSTLADCSIEHKVHDCYEKVKFPNRFTIRGSSYDYEIGSYHMGLPHMYHSMDFSVQFFSDKKSKSHKLYCFGQVPPMLSSYKDVKKNPVPLTGSPNNFVPPDFEESGCKGAETLFYPELILADQKLLDRSWQEVKSTSKGYIFEDFIYLLEDAVVKKNNLDLYNPEYLAGASWPKKYNLPHHELCVLSKTISSIACPNYLGISSSINSVTFESTGNYLLKREMRKIASNPNTSAYKTRKKMQIERAKFNYAAIKLCLTEIGDDDLNNGQTKENSDKHLLHGCLYRYVSPYQFWECKYYGYKDLPCFNNMINGEGFRENFYKVREYIRENQMEFDSINFNNWVFYDRMEF